MHHEVLRPIRDGERGHRDHPGASSTWCLMSKRRLAPRRSWPPGKRGTRSICGFTASMSPRLWTTPPTPQAMPPLHSRIALRFLPAQSAEGFRVKIRALSHYNSSFFYSTLPDLPDPDQALSHSLWRDVQGEPQQTPATVEAALDCPAGTDPDFSGHRRQPARRSRMEATEAASAGA